MNDVLKSTSDAVVRGVILDMDDTLFLEHSYVLSGIAAVAQYLSRLTGEGSDKIRARLSYRFLKFGRRQLFDSELGEPAVCTMEELVGIYRVHQPDIHLFEGVAAALEQLSQKWPVALVTDGAQIMQERKVQALKLNELIPHIVYCDEVNAPKPSPTAFLKAAELMGVAPSNCLVIGDDPTADMAGAKAAGMHAIRVMSGRYALLEDEEGKYFKAPSFIDAVQSYI